ncbi:MAG TPA: helix-turn-helix transcriptional regulator [Blastocatellia bacterium]|nr:helix-turn-helix transcriptional regulator [Blastocatellia bacterium]
MIKITIQEMAQRRGITTAYQLQKALQIQPDVAAGLWKGELSKIGIVSLDRLCRILRCQPCGLIRYIPNDDVPPARFVHARLARESDE